MRLNQALRELNIGLQRAVEFLEKRADLGEVKQDLSFKLSDAQYRALVEAFKQDAAVKDKAGKLFPKKQPKDKKQKSHKGEDLLNSEPQKYKPLGKIDLEGMNKKNQNKTDKDVKAAATSQTPKVEKESVKVEQKVQTVPETPKVEKQKRSEEHTSELQSPDHLVCRLLLEKKQ